MRAWRGWPAAALALAMLLASPSAARAQEMLLKQEPWRSGPALGWTFAGLSVAALAVTVNGYSESRTALSQADKAYEQYSAATTTADALYYRSRTEHYHNRAKAYESTANAAGWLAVAFALTSYYSFYPERAPAWPVVATVDGVVFVHRF
ncbi:MAG: hypothetical protein HY423_14560 [Candidatus Lambdaproteobacteria bacterium]|nr:hypothetical protein [Candidatus Lambdaproteobacteria bacterium]